MMGLKVPSNVALLQIVVGVLTIVFLTYSIVEKHKILTENDKD